MRWFGTDGIRGRAFEGLFTAQKLQCVGRAFGYYLSTQCSSNLWILIGVDTRGSGPEFASALSLGLEAAGVRYRYVGVCSSPALAWLTQYYGAHLGIMLSASHNPAEYNGIKCFHQDGTKLSIEEECSIEDCIAYSLEQRIDHPNVSVNALREEVSLQDPYMNALRQGHSLKGLKVVLDGAHGSLWDSARVCFERCGAEVLSSIGNAPDGNNINAHVGVLHPEHLQWEVSKFGADLGFCFDGDGDRVGVVDGQGHYWNGDHILAVLSSEASGVVGTSMSNYGLEMFCIARGQTFIRVDVGDRWVSQALSKYQLRWGGESSGHIIDQNFLPVGDGLWIALTLAELFLRGKKIPLFPGFKPYPGVQCNMHVTDKACLDLPELKSYLAQFQSHLGVGVRMVIRPSGTEPLIRILLEGSCLEHLKDAMHQLTTQLTGYTQGAIESIACL